MPTARLMHTARANLGISRERKMEQNFLTVIKRQRVNLYRLRKRTPALIRDRLLLSPTDGRRVQ